MEAITEGEVRLALIVGEGESDALFLQHTREEGVVALVVLHLERERRVRGCIDGEGGRLDEPARRDERGQLVGPEMLEDAVIAAPGVRSQRAATISKR